MKKVGANVDHWHEAAIAQWIADRIIMKRKEPERTGILWRLTWPLWAIIFVLLVVIAFPINWIFTGNYRLTEQQKLYKLLKPWHKKLFP